MNMQENESTTQTKPTNNLIVLIEDDRDIRVSLMQLLEFEGYRVLTAENGKDGLTLLKKNPTPKLIILDLMMPVMNGWQFLEAKKENPELAPLPVLVITAISDGIKPSQGIDVMKKPVEVEALLKIINKYN